MNIFRDGSIDLGQLYKSSIGFDKISTFFEAAAKDFQPYPHYNIELVGDNHYVMTLAVAGFSPEEISVETSEGVLVISGQSTQKEKKNYLYQGIAARNFERRLRLADYVEVTDVSLDKGILSIDLVRSVPDAKKPKQFKIKAAA